MVTGLVEYEKAGGNGGGKSVEHVAVPPTAANGPILLPGSGLRKQRS